MKVHPTVRNTDRVTATHRRDAQHRRDAVAYRSQRHDHGQNVTRFADYLAGLIEGDGHINRAQLIIIFHGNHESGARDLCTLLGGTVARGKTSYSWRYVLGDRVGLGAVLTMTYASWVGPYRLDQVRHHGWDRSLGFALQRRTLTLACAWIAGFTDADGCWDLSIRQCKTCTLGVRVELRVTHSQKHPYPLEQIARVFGLAGLHRDKVDGACRIAVSGRRRLALVVVPYFDTYHPVIKRDQYQIWRQAYDLVETKAHLTRDGLAQIRRLKAAMTRLKCKSASPGPRRAARTVPSGLRRAERLVAVVHANRRGVSR